MVDSSQQALIALFASRDEAESAASRLDDAVRTEILGPGDTARVEAFAKVDTDETVKDVTTGAVLGALGGAGGAALAGLTILATGPVAAAAIGAGLGAGAGALGGAAGSTAVHRPVLAGALRDALAGGRHALLIGVDGEAAALEVQDALERTAALKVIDRHGGQHGVRGNVG